VERLQRREDLRAELEEPLRRAQVLEPVLPQVAHLDAGEIRRRLREQHLAAVPGGGDPRRAVHVEADVALVAEPLRLAGVHAHPHAHRPVARPRVGGERALRVGGAGHRVPRPPEDVEEGVALRVDLPPTVLPERASHDLGVLAEDAPVVAAKRLQEPGRALDVGEHERDRAGEEPRVRGRGHAGVAGRSRLVMPRR
jgi:hypothetical protein